MNNSRLSKMLLTYVILVAVLLMSAEQVSSNRRHCYLFSDIVFAVDTTSSQSSRDFDVVKSEVKKIAENFTLGQAHVRFGLVSIAMSAHVEVNFDAVNSLRDFKKAVDKLSYSTETPDLSEGIKVSKDSLLDRARPKASKILILVKDRRSAGRALYDNNVLSRMKSEAMRVTGLKTTINVVGVGGLWSTVEVQALYGPQSLLFKSKEKALASIKNLEDKYCEAECPVNATKTLAKQGHCYGSLRHQIHSRVLLADNAVGIQVCRKEIIRQFESCRDENIRCNSFIGERIVGKCNPTTDRINVDTRMEYFVKKEQACHKQTKSNSVKCSKVNECPNQVADIVFVLDKSGSIDTHFSTLTAATAEIVKHLNIGKDQVIVSVISFNDGVRTEIKYGQVNDKNTLLQKINAIDQLTESYTNTHLALEEARNILTLWGRHEVTKLVILITDAQSNNQSETLRQINLLKNNNIQLYVVGLADANLSELQAMTAPETKETLDILKGFSELQPWSRKFSETLCMRLSPPAPELCHDNVFVQSVTPCQNGVRYVANTRYTFESKSARNCIKSSQSTQSRNCKQTCVSPTDGNEYVDGDSWESLCYVFKCENGVAKVEKSMCMASDGSCKSIDSPAFNCLDENKKEVNNCQCVKTSEGATLVMERS